VNASELVAKLERMIHLYGDKEVAVDNGLSLQPIEDIDLGSEEDDNPIVIWVR